MSVTIVDSKTIEDNLPFMVRFVVKKVSGYEVVEVAF